MPEQIPVEHSAHPPLNAIQKSVMQSEVIEALRMVFDPEIPVNIYDLGLIYEIRVKENADVDIDMTLTSPACPVAESLPIEAQNAVEGVSGIGQVTVNMVWDPPFSIDRIPEHVRLDLGLL